jgi:hypothetical protein
LGQRFPRRNHKAGRSRRERKKSASPRKAKEIQPNIRDRVGTERQSGKSGPRLRRKEQKRTAQSRRQFGVKVEASPSQRNPVHVGCLFRIAGASREHQRIGLHSGPLHGFGQNFTGKGREVDDSFG